MMMKFVLLHKKHLLVYFSVVITRYKILNIYIFKSNNCRKYKYDVNGDSIKCTYIIMLLCNIHLY